MSTYFLSFRQKTMNTLTLINFIFLYGGDYVIIFLLYGIGAGIITNIVLNSLNAKLNFRKKIYIGILGKTTTYTHPKMPRIIAYLGHV